MFERDLAGVGEQMTQVLAGLGIPSVGEVKWQPTPFPGEWGQGTNLAFLAAAAEAKSGKKVNVPARAQELARLLAETVKLPQGFGRIIADKAYVNLYFDTASYAGRVAAAAIDQGADFGRGAPKAERVMVEYAQQIGRASCR